MIVFISCFSPEVYNKQLTPRSLVFKEVRSFPSLLKHSEITLLVLICIFIYTNFKSATILLSRNKASNSAEHKKANFLCNAQLFLNIQSPSFRQFLYLAVLRKRLILYLIIYYFIHCPSISNSFSPKTRDNPICWHPCINSYFTFYL